MEIRLTKHAVERGKERLGLNRKALQRTADRAFAEGLQVKDTSGTLRRYLDGLGMTYKKGNNTRVYGLHVYIIQRCVLITVLHLPRQYWNAVAKRKSG